MGKLIVVVAIVALLAGGLSGFLWWGQSARQTQAELGVARHQADDLEQKLREAEQRLAAAESDVRRTNEMNRRLQMLVSEGKK
jgi:uncharacterized protein HemX